MNHAYAHQLNMVTIECYKCFVVFGVPADMQRRLRETGNSFYCPAGHSQCYTKSELARTRELLEKANRTATALVAETTMLRDQRDHAKRQFNGMKGQLVKTQKRAAKGVCPCCTRSFSNVQRHMATMHPSYGEGEQA